MLGDGTNKTHIKYKKGCLHVLEKKKHPKNDEKAIKVMEKSKINNILLVRVLKAQLVQNNTQRTERSEGD